MLVDDRLQRSRITPTEPVEKALVELRHLLILTTAGVRIGSVMFAPLDALTPMRADAADDPRHVERTLERDHDTTGDSKFAGDTVKLTGNVKGDTITVTKIEKAK